MTVDSESVLLTVSEVADVLAHEPEGDLRDDRTPTTARCRRIGRRVLIRRADLLHWLDQNCASSLKGVER